MLNAHLSHLALAVPDVEKARRFYEEVVGLVTVGESDVVHLGLGEGDYVLELKEGEGIDRFGLEVPDADELERVLGVLADDSVDVEEGEQYGGKAGFSFRDPDGHRVLLHGPIDRSGESSGEPGRRPLRMHHVTLSTAEPLQLAAFYTRLGFLISDRMGEDFAWLRCNREHHTLALVAGPPGGLDHYCFEVADWDSLKTWCDELAVRGVPLTWGPGRHGPGNNLFIMFDDPAGVHIELSCEMERFWDDRVEYSAPRNWAAVPGTINLWGVVPAMRESVTPTGAP